MTSDPPIYRPPAGGGPRPFRFGVNAKRASSREEWAERARICEDLGYSTLFVGDHVRDQWSPLVGLTAAADATTTLRVGTSVLNNDLRNPVMLAQEVATLDVVSQGRFELGLGAGYSPDDYAATSITRDRAATRIARLDESITIMKQYFRDGLVDFEGEHYRVEGAKGFPRPLSAPWPPICVGGGGPKVLAVAGRQADIVSISPSFGSGSLGDELLLNADADAFAERIDWIREAAGDRFDDIELHLSVLFGGVGSKADRVEARLRHDFGLTGADSRNVPVVLVGSPEEACDTLLRWRDQLGITYVSVPDPRGFAKVVDRLAREPTPGLRAVAARAVRPARTVVRGARRRLRSAEPSGDSSTPTPGWHRVLMIGAGGMGGIWLDKYLPQLADRVEIAGLVDVVPEVLRKRGEALKVRPEHRYGSIDEGFAAVAGGKLEDVDACFVVIPPEHHREAVEAAASAGIDVLCEKPVAGSWHDCVAAAKAVRAAGIRMQVVQNYRYLPEIEVARAILESGELGPVTHLVSQFAADYRERDSWGAPFRHEMRHAVLLEAGAHHLDQARHLVGSDLTTVTAMDWLPEWATGFDGEPCAFVAGEFANGARYSYEANAVAAGPERSWRTELYRVECAGGTLVVDRGVTVWQHRARGLTATPHRVPGGRAGHLVVIEQFLDWLDGAPPPPTALDDNINTAGTIFAAIESAETGRPVALDRLLAELEPSPR